MSPKRNNNGLVLLLCSLLAADGAWALKTDKNQPINVRADHGDFKSDPDNNSNGTGIYLGHVVITQGSIMLTADKAVLHVVNNELDTADVTGNPATFQQRPDHGEMMHGTAQEITYNASNNEVVLITNARLTQVVTQQLTDTSTPGAPARTAPGERLMTADRIRYDTDTQHVIAKAGNDEDRVHISFPPKTQPPTPLHKRPPHRAPSSTTAPAEATASAPAASTQDGNGP
ncbi:MAG: lipopolysaccharide transport periplasmic protein LptA [Bacillota bacterium]